MGIVFVLLQASGTSLVSQEFLKIIANGSEITFALSPEVL